MNPYLEYVRTFASSARNGRKLNLGAIPAPSHPKPSDNAPVAMIFSPHPDDECIVGGLAYRLQRECGWRVVNVAVTQGSNRPRQSGRAAELRGACAYLGFEIRWFEPSGLEQITAAARSSQPGDWGTKVHRVATLLAAEKPAVIFSPHGRDWNGTHIGTHHLVMDAMVRWNPLTPPVVVETEYWGAMDQPNLMVEIPTPVLGDLVAGASFHVEEMRRNPFHLLLPAWMQDNVRRGSEVVGGQGNAAPDYDFATLYRVCCWTSGILKPLWEGGRKLDATASPAALFQA